jgi:aconitate hydratase
MAPEYGATCGIFPIDAEALTYLRLSGRSSEQMRWSRPMPRRRACGTTPIPRTPPTRRRWNSSWRRKPSLAGPKRPQDRVLLECVKDNFHKNSKA